MGNGKAKQKISYNIADCLLCYFVDNAVTSIGSRQYQLQLLKKIESHKALLKNFNTKYKDKKRIITNLEAGLKSAKERQLNSEIEISKLQEQLKEVGLFSNFLNN